jgi:hypothetical protein
METNDTIMPERYAAVVQTAEDAGAWQRYRGSNAAMWRPAATETDAHY